VNKPGFDLDGSLEFCVYDVKVRHTVLVVVHGDDEAMKAAELGHSRRFVKTEPRFVTKSTQRIPNPRRERMALCLHQLHFPS
jgi:carbonic anhydrase